MRVRETELNCGRDPERERDKVGVFIERGRERESDPSQ